MPPKPSSTPKNVASKGTTPQEGHSKTRVSQGSARKDVTAGQSNKTLAAAALRMKPSEELLAKSTGDETAITVKSKASARQIQDTIYGEIVEARKEKNLSLLANAIRHLDDELKKIMASQIKVFQALQATFRVEGKIEWIAIPPIPQELASNYNARNLLIYSLIARLDMAKQLEQFLWQPLDDFVPIPYERRPSQLKEYDDSLTAMIVQGLTREAGELDERLRAKARYQLEADDGDYKKQGKARLHMKHILLFNMAQVEVAFQEMKNLQAEIVLPIDEYWWRSILIDPDFDHIHHFQVMKASNNRYRKRCEMNFRVTERQKVIMEAAEKMIVSVESLQNSLKAFK